MNQLDLLLATLPPNYLNEPPIAPALLKSAVEKQGFTCRTLDFSLHCLQKIFKGHYETYLEWGNSLPNHVDYNKVSEQHKFQLNQAINEFLNLLEEFNPRFLALSVFSLWQQRFCYFLCQKIKNSKFECKIIIGGMGCTQPPKGLYSISSLNYFEKKTSFANFMLSKKLTDFAIVNDGEQELVNVLRSSDNYLSSLISNETKFDYDYVPSFDDYKLDQYLFTNNEKKLLVQGSKGCIRQCVFCSEHSNYSQYYFKTGIKIANEVIYLSKKYGIYKFQFTDSLTNGSLKEFKNFVRILAEYNQTNPQNQIKWHGNYICRTQNQMTNDDFQLLKLSGAHGLTIGAESGSNRVLAEMKKNTTVEDLLYEITKFHQYNIDCNLLFLIGFYNETWQDFLSTLDLLKKLQRYFFDGTISNIRLGYTLMFDDAQHYRLNDFEYTSDNPYDWIWLKNSTLTLRERVRRRIIAQEFCDALGIPVAFAREDLIVLNSIYNNMLSALEESAVGTH